MQTKRGVLLSIFFIAGFAIECFARTIALDPQIGNDSHLGDEATGPVQTFRRAIALAVPGDLIAVAKSSEPIRQSILIQNKSGKAGEPIIIEGNGALLSGATPITPPDEEIRPGVYRFRGVLKKAVGDTPSDQSVQSAINRFFLIWNGTPHRMGRSSKGDKPGLPKAEALRPGEWTLERETLSLVIALEPGRPIEAERIEIPTFSNGVQFTGNSSHWIIRNLHVRHVLNDGFNLHGTGSDILFETISATECGDDGLSAHGRCELTVRGFIAQGNSTGLCHIDESRSQQEDIRLVGNTAYDLLLLGSGTHRFKNGQIESRHRGIQFGAAPEKQCRVQIEDVTILNAAKPGGKQPVVKLRKGAEVSFERITLSGMNFVADSESAATLHSSIVNAPLGFLEIASGANWKSDHNRFHLKELRWNGNAYSLPTFEEYRAASLQDRHSEWTAHPMGVSPDGIGATSRNPAGG